MEIPRHWRLKKQRYNLVGEVCPHCNHKQFPPNGVCRNCGDEAKVLYSAPPIEKQPEEAHPQDQNIFAVAVASLP